MKITVSDRMVKVYTLFDIYNTKNILSQCHALLMRFLIGHKRFPLLIIICDIYLFICIGNLLSNINGFIYLIEL